MARIKGDDVKRVADLTHLRLVVKPEWAKKIGLVNLAAKGAAYVIRKGEAEPVEPGEDPDG